MTESDLLKCIKTLREFKPFHTREGQLAECLNDVSVEGLFLEFGVYKGETATIIANRIIPSRLYAFDSFQGLPDVWVRNKKRVSKVGRFKLESLPVVPDNVELVVGWFDKTLPEFTKKHTDPVAFINIDCDIYASTVTILEELNLQIVPGTIIYFDEFCEWDYRRRPTNRYDNWKEHEYKATLEWLQKHNREIEPHSRNTVEGASFIVTK